MKENDQKPIQNCKQKSSKEYGMKICKKTSKELEQKVCSKFIYYLSKKGSAEGLGEKLRIDVCKHVTSNYAERYAGKEQETTQECKQERFVKNQLKLRNNLEWR